MKTTAKANEPEAIRKFGNKLGFLRKVGIQFRLIVSFLIISLIPLAVTSVITFNKSSYSIESKISTYSTQIVNQTSRNIGSDMGKLTSIITNLSLSTDVQELLNSVKGANYDKLLDINFTLTKIMQNERLTKPEIEQMQIYIDSNTILYVGDYFLTADQAFKLSSQINSKDEFKWSILKTPDKGVKLVLSKKIVSLFTGECIGMISLIVNPHYFESTIKDLDFGNNSEVFILDSDGKIIVDTDMAVLNTGTFYKQPKLIQNINSHNLLFNVNIDGANHLVSASNIPSSNWFVVAVIPYRYIHSESNSIRQTIILVSLICLIFAWILSYFITQSVSWPLKNLIHSMSLAETGNLNIRLSDKGRDEISDVNNKFDGMLQKIKNLMVDRELKEKERMRSELDALQSQINPHFISNTLNAIRFMSMAAKMDNIKCMSESLIKLVTASYSRGGSLTTVEDEINNLKCYLSIMQARYSHRLNVNFEIDNEINKLLIIKLLLQPILENAIIYGISQMETHGEIVVNGKISNETIIFEIKDNGCGMTAEQINRLLNEDTKSTRHFSSIGIRNVDQRIRLNYGDNFGLKIDSVPNEYTSVKVILPIVTTSEGDAQNV